MKKLLKIYGLIDNMGYYELIVNSFLNGQFNQAYEQFRGMPKPNRVDFLKSATVGGWNSGLGDHKLLQLFDNILK